MESEYPSSTRKDKIMTFYTTIILDKDKTPAHFKIEAESAAWAVRILGAYCKGLFEGSGSGADIQSVTKAKLRGVEYRGL